MGVWRIVLVCIVCVATGVPPCVARTVPIVATEEASSGGGSEGVVSMASMERNDWTNATSNQTDLLATLQAIRAIRELSASSAARDSARRSLRSIDALAAAKRALARALGVFNGDAAAAAAADDAWRWTSFADLDAWDSVGSSQRDDEADDGDGGEEGTTVQAQAQTQPIPHRGCMTRDPDANDLRMVETSTQRHNHTTPALLMKSGAVSRGLGMWVPVVFHVVHRPNGDGRISMTAIERQIDVLNAGYANTLTNGLDSGMRFVLSDVRYLSHDTWYSLCNVHARAITQAHTVRADTHLNVFTCSGEGLLGWVTGFPWDFSTMEDTYQAIFMSKDTMLRGGVLAPMYDQGRTLVHEVGHFFGLFHTFQGGCLDPGDGIDDTPAQGRPTYGSCAANNGKDSCFGGGPDDVKNYMDYSDDACMDHFSDLQVERMADILEDYRPKMLAFGRELADLMEGETPAPVDPLPPTAEPTPTPSPGNNVVITLTPASGPGAPGIVQALDDEVSLPSWLVAVLVWVLTTLVELLGGRRAQ